MDFPKHSEFRGTVSCFHAVFPQRHPLADPAPQALRSQCPALICPWLRAISSSSEFPSLPTTRQAWTALRQPSPSSPPAPIIPEFSTLHLTPMRQPPPGIADVLRRQPSSASGKPTGAWTPSVFPFSGIFPVPFFRLQCLPAEHWSPPLAHTQMSVRRRDLLHLPSQRPPSLPAATVLTTSSPTEASDSYPCPDRLHSRTPRHDEPRNKTLPNHTSLAVQFTVRTEPLCLPERPPFAAVRTLSPGPLLTSRKSLPSCFYFLPGL